MEAVSLPANPLSKRLVTLEFQWNLALVGDTMGEPSKLVDPEGMKGLVTMYELLKPEEF